MCVKFKHTCKELSMRVKLSTCVKSLPCEIVSSEQICVSVDLQTTPPSLHCLVPESGTL